MIEHTIRVTKEEPKKETPPQQQHPVLLRNNSYHLTYDELMAYQENAIKRGYRIGARISTQYGMKGTIDSFRTFHKDGVTMLNNTKPGFIYIKYDNQTHTSCALYSEDELTLL